MRVVIQHRSRYLYPRPALLGPQVIRLRPADHTRARIERYRLVVEPEHRLHWQRDPHGNHVARVTFKAGQTTPALDILVELALDIRPINPFDFFIDERVRTVPFRYPEQLDAELAPYLDTGDPAYRLGRAGTELLAALPAHGDTLDLLVGLNTAVRQRIAYVIRDEPGVWTPEETLGHGRGSCRDAAVLLVALMRARGIAARFVSGYLVQLTDEGMIPDEPKGVDRDVIDLHAWAEAYVPGAGWIGFDGTSGLLCGEGHIPLAATASPAHAAPLDGTSDVAARSVEFTTTIARLGHEARPTAPYSDEVWAELQAAGDRADAALTAAGLDVWIGGEPTFTARDDQARPEWQGGALGPDKWKRGRRLARELRDRLAPGGVILHRTGKQYPGESLPRWALDVIARRPGLAEPAGPAAQQDERPPLWPDRTLAEAGTIGAAHHLGEELCAALGVRCELHPAYEDPWEVLRAEARLPAEIDPRTAGLDDPEERRRLAAILDRGAGEVVGWVVPLARSEAGWRTERWRLRREHLFLVPGDSPVGLRLPLASITGAAAPEWAEAPDLPDPRRGAPDGDQPRRATGTAPAAARPAEPPPPLPGIRTALAIEPRDGELWVFVPPLAKFDEFCELVDAIDRARVATGLSVHLEGYPPPPAPDRLRFAVTPDPGVLEVNLPPVASCREAAGLYHRVFEAALASGLTAERYLLDGRAAGSGGGNHITIGGPWPERSPWLREPGLLASLVTFAQHHPSLSYLFTGLFVGPTSQAPRLDEARHDALYELELALPRLHEGPPPWQVDALLRHLLVDVAGSTHRAEISIDKLFDPQTPHGRQGLVELRAFEMPPHPRMLAAQAILVRALIAAFAAEPYKHALVRWGSELHDRFLLPYFLWHDFEDVLGHLAARGVALPEGAYRPFVELRCPLAGTIEVGAARIEVRNAIEPWHVLGEEATQAGTARYVDSSVERIELRAIGLDHERYVVAVNHAVVPMRPGAGRDVRVGGVRFRAWCPPHALHPHLGIHHPLRIDVVDTWARRGVAGAAYHVWHPEGRAFDAPPLTRTEADARKSQRFTREGPTPWPLRARRVAPHPDQPYTLDLRRIDAGTAMPDPEDWITP
ncbi:MAG TPA: transglutaminase family protein [Kofleriaceae bacterium]|nr:transglutaminase family protein [Kofleriaceae bacterium]